MKTKLFPVLLVLFFVAGSLMAQKAKTNAPAGIPNFYQNQYGTTVGNARSATDALVFVDYVLGSDFIVPVLVSFGYSVTVASDWSDFDTKLATGDYGLAVGGNQNSTPLPSAEVVQSYINGGGCMIFDDWTRDATLGAIFEASYTGVDDQNQMTISDALLAQGVSNPLSFVNTGWGIYTMGMTATGGGQVLATFPNGDAAVVRGNGGRTILLGYLTDVPVDTDRQKLFENVVNSTLCGSIAPVPVSNWALYIGIFLIISFTVIRFRKMI